MECPKCKSALRIGITYMTFKNDDTPDAPTEAYTNMPMCCVNPECGTYAGDDLSKPTHVVETKVNKLN